MNMNMVIDIDVDIDMAIDMVIGLLWYFVVDYDDYGIFIMKVINVRVLWWCGVRGVCLVVCLHL